MLPYDLKTMNCRDTDTHPDTVTQTFEYPVFWRAISSDSQYIEANMHSAK